MISEPHVIDQIRLNLADTSGNSLSDPRNTTFNFLNATMALRKVKGNFERMFDKNLTDLVRGIRNNKENEVILRIRSRKIYRNLT